MKREHFSSPIRLTSTLLDTIACLVHTAALRYFAFATFTHKFGLDARSPAPRAQFITAADAALFPVYSCTYFVRHSPFVSTPYVPRHSRTTLRLHPYRACCTAHAHAPYPTPFPARVCCAFGSFHAAGYTLLCTDGTLLSYAAHLTGSRFGLVAARMVRVYHPLRFTHRTPVHAHAAPQPVPPYTCTHTTCPSIWVGQMDSSLPLDLG